MFDEKLVTANPGPAHKSLTLPARILLTIACISTYPHHDDLRNLTYLYRILVTAEGSGGSLGLRHDQFSEPARFTKLSRTTPPFLWARHNKEWSGPCTHAQNAFGQSLFE